MTKAGARLPIALTMGEPAGIGGDITLKTWLGREPLGLPPFFAIDDADRLKRLSGRLGWTIPVEVISEPGEAAAVFAHALPVLHRPLAVDVEPGQPDRATASAVIESIETGVRLTLEGKAAAVTTNPIHKASVTGPDFPYEGHTQFVAALCTRPGEKPIEPVMMLANDALKVALATIHIPLHDVPDALSVDGLLSVAQIVLNALKNDFAIDRPRLAVTGLNPHAGEDGLMGTEEQTVIKPVLERLRTEGWAVTGPHAADSLFHEKARSGYDAALCMYHDQGLIPLKTIDFETGVNLTLGLPIVRTSPDHGTAFDIAGTGKASELSLAAALRMADDLATRKQEKALRRG